LENILAIGKSNRIVIEIEPEIKEQIYKALQKKGGNFEALVY